MSKRIRVILDLDPKGFVTGVKGAEEQTASLSSRLLSMKTLVGGLFAGAAIAGLRRGVGVIRDLVESARGQMQAEAMLAQAMKNRGTYTQEGMQGNLDYANSMQQATVFGDEQILQVMAQMTAHGLTNDEMRRGVQIAADLASVDKNLASAAEMVTRAYQGNYMAIARYDASVAKLAQTGATATQVIDALSKVGEGMAEARASTPLGQLDQMANAWNDIKESVGMGIAEGFTSAARAMGLTSQEFTKLVQESSAFITLGIVRHVESLGQAFQLVSASAELVLKNIKAVGTFMSSVDWPKTGRGLLQSVRGGAARAGAETIAAREQFNATVLDVGMQAVNSELRYQEARDAIQRRALQREKDLAAAGAVR